jgi:carbonic anhydrase/acetyltransferase-like protein (isoleucine patch superfamily)
MKVEKFNNKEPNISEKALIQSGVKIIGDVEIACDASI